MMLEDRLPAVTGVTAAIRRRQDCAARRCRFVGERLNQALLTFAAAVVGAALLLRLVPGWTSELLQSLI